MLPYFMQSIILENQEEKAVLNNIQLVVYDFDGVMTDNRVILREDGLESVVVNRSDGLAVSIIKNMGIPQMIMSKEQNKVVETRARKLGIPVLKGIDNKQEVLIEHCRNKNISLSNVVYIGNDINDVEVMRIVGHPVCPQDAYPEVRAISKFVIPVNGGSGVVRALLNYIEKREEA